MLAKHSAIYLVAKILPAVLSLATLAIFTRLLTPEQYGTYSLTIMTAGFFNTVCLQWVVLGVGRYVPDCQNETEKHHLLGTARLIIFLISVVLLPFFLLLSYFKSSIDFSILFYMLGFLVLAQSWYDLNLKIMNAQLNPVRYGLVLGLKSIVAFVLSSCAVYMGYGADGAILSLTFALIVATGLGRQIWKKIPWLAMNKHQIEKLWHYGVPLTGTFLLVFIINASDRFFIDKVLGVRELGTYSAAYDFTQYSVGTLLSVVHLAAFPLVINAYAKHGTVAAQAQLQKTFVLVFAVLAPITVGLVVVSDTVSQVIMGREFVQIATQIMPWLALAFFFSCFRAYYFDYAFQLASSTKKLLVTFGLAAIANLVLNFLLIPVYGVIGAAVATVLSFLIALLASFVLGSRSFDMPSLAWGEALKILLAVGLMVLVVKLVNIGQPFWELICQVCLGGFVYAIAILGFNILKTRDWVFERVKKV
jgi:O-antigen/teichoic acid export membrane protein